MNQKSTVTLVLSFAAFAASLCSLASAAAYQPRHVVGDAPIVAVSPADRAPSDASSQPTASIAEESYSTKIIRLHRGKIAVFEENSDTPIKLLPTDVEQLPDDAVERLQKGVYAYTAEQYRNYIEDFS